MVDSLTGEELKVALPRWAAERCPAGWTISGVLGRRRTTWEIVEIWNVYP